MTDKKNGGPDLDYVCFLGQGSVIRDQTFITSSHLKITGMVELAVECQGNLVISAGGMVIGNITAGNVHVYGKVRGTIKAANNVHLYKGSEVIGEINCDFLKVEEGTSCRIDADTGEHADARNSELMQAMATNYKEKKGALESDFQRYAGEVRLPKPISSPGAYEGSQNSDTTGSLTGKHTINGHENKTQNGYKASNGQKTSNGNGKQNQSASSTVATGRFAPEKHASQTTSKAAKAVNTKKPLFF